MVKLQKLWDWQLNRLDLRRDWMIFAAFIWIRTKLHLWWQKWLDFRKCGWFWCHLITLRALELDVLLRIQDILCLLWWEMTSLGIHWMELEDRRIRTIWKPTSIIRLRQIRQIRWTEKLLAKCSRLAWRQWMDLLRLEKDRESGFLPVQVLEKVHFLECLHAIPKRISM